MSAAIKDLSLEIDSTATPVLLVGRDHTVSYANTAAYQLLGYAPGSLTGLSLQWLAPPSRHGELRNVDDVLSGQTGRRIRSMVLSSTGELMDVTMDVEPCVDAAGRVVAVSISYTRSGITHHSRMPALPRAAFAHALHARPEHTRSQEGSSHPPAPAARGSESANCPPASGARPIPYEPLEDGDLREKLEERLDSSLQLLTWVAHRLAAPIHGASLDDPRERTRALLVLDEARALLRECRDGLTPPAAPSIPRASRLPNL